MTTSNCLVCLYRSSLYVARFFSPIKPRCSYTALNFTHKPTYTVSKISLIVNLLVLIIFLFSSFTCIPAVINVCKTQTSHCLIITSDEIFIVGNTITTTIFLLQIRTICQELEAWSSLVLNQPFYGFDDALNPSGARTLFYIKCFSTTTTTFWMVYAGTVYFWFSIFDDTLPWSFPRRIGLLYSAAVQWHMTLELCQKFVLTGKLLQAIEAALPRQKFFPRHSYALLAINSIIRVSTHLVTNFLLTWTFTAIVFLVFSFSALFYYSELTTLTVLILQSKTIFCSAVMVMLYCAHDYCVKAKVSGRTAEDESRSASVPEPHRFSHKPELAIKQMNTGRS